MRQVKISKRSDILKIAVTMALKFRLVVFLVISVMLELSCICQGQRYDCIFKVCKRVSISQFVN